MVKRYCKIEMALGKIADLFGFQRGEGKGERESERQTDRQSDRQL